MVIGLSWPFVFFLPGQSPSFKEAQAFLTTHLHKLSWFKETYGPRILVRRAQNVRGNGDPNAVTPTVLQKVDVREIITVVITRPIRLFAEPMVLSACSFMALILGLYFLFFQVYSIIFEGSLVKKMHCVMDVK